MTWPRCGCSRRIEYVAATETVAEMIELVEKMLASGAAYVVDDADYPDVYFRSDATVQFGYESGYDRDTMLRLFAERGGDPDRPGKTDQLDALVWRAARPGEPSWPSPFGPGRPGWHVECAAIALSRIHGDLDIQGGGSDLIFPHHEFTAAHAECVTGAKTFRPSLRTRRHDRLGRAQDVQEPRQPGAGVRACAARASSRQQSGWVCCPRTIVPTAAWSAEVLAEAAARLQRWRAATALPAGPDATDTVARLRRYLADDLNTPKALAAVDGWSTDALDYGGHDSAAPRAVAAAVDALLGVQL